MFIQVIQGSVADPDAMHEAQDRWASELAPRSVGWLGGTAGCTEDGTFIAVERFESEQKARLNSERPEQHQWWVETAKLFSGDVTFHDCREVEVFSSSDADLDKAGFVQIIQGRTTDPDRLRTMMRGMDKQMSEWRPEVMGVVLAIHPDNGFTQVVYFTSESEARQGEAKEMPPQLKATMDAERDLFTGEQKYFDLKSPWLYSH